MKLQKVEAKNAVHHTLLMLLAAHPNGVCIDVIKKEVDTNESVPMLIRQVNELGVGVVEFYDIVTDMYGNDREFPTYAIMHKEQAVEIELTLRNKP
jgi:hypothetical protein